MVVKLCQIEPLKNAFIENINSINEIFLIIYALLTKTFHCGMITMLL